MEYYIIIAASVCIILSYFFNRVASKTNIPSVLLLIALGIVLKNGLTFSGIDRSTILSAFSEIKLLEVLGTLGLILIVLEAALELKLKRSKNLLIVKSFSVAFIGLTLCTASIGWIFTLIWEDMGFLSALIYATPLSILSSAIVIPSVIGLSDEEEEFHIYESTFSDILGIMVFYFLLSLKGSENNAEVVRSYALSVLITIILSIVLSYILIYIFQNLETKIKLFLMISILVLLFSIGKLLHLSSLLVILIFGLILNNYKVLFIGPLKKYIRPVSIEKIKESFLMITVESAFVVRTFFFILFGFSISLMSLLDVEVVVISLALLALIYATRIISLLPFKRKGMLRTASIAPRGLITLLLFYSIPPEFQYDKFGIGVLLFIIIVSSLIMIPGLLHKNIELPAEEVNERI